MSERPLHTYLGELVRAEWAANKEEPHKAIEQERGGQQHAGPTQMVTLDFLIGLPEQREKARKKGELSQIARPL